MAKVAKIIQVSVFTRIIVEDGLTEEQELEVIADTVKERCHSIINESGIGDLIDSIEEDTECPYGSLIYDNDC